MRRRSLTLLVLPLAIICVTVLSANEAQGRRTARLAILNVTESALAAKAAPALAQSFKNNEIAVVDMDQSRAAAKGVGYGGSLNLTLQEARDLGSAVGSEYYILSEVQSIRRSRSDEPTYFEAYASLFLVSSRSGRLVYWERPSFENATALEADKLLLASVASNELHQRFSKALLSDVAEPVGENGSNAEFEDEQSAEAKGIQLPRPFQRLRPSYPESAARADATATVDVLANIDASGKVTQVEIVRWAGFGLDHETTETVRRINFFPAMKNGKPIPIRVMLRYNFRNPKKEND